MRLDRPYHFVWISETIFALSIRIKQHGLLTRLLDLVYGAAANSS